MLIDTNGFEIGDEVWWWTYSNDIRENNIKTSNHSKIVCFQMYKSGLFVDVKDRCESLIPIKYCFHTEQQAIDYCNHMNGELC
jgi:hypothetical protein